MCSRRYTTIIRPYTHIIVVYKMSNLSWRYAGHPDNTCLIEKVGGKCLRNMKGCAKEYFSLPGLVRTIFIKDANMGGSYFRFFGFFEDDANRYFHTLRNWDLVPRWDDLETGLVFQSGDNLWKVKNISEDINTKFFFEFERITPK